MNEAPVKEEVEFYLQDILLTLKIRDSGKCLDSIGLNALKKEVYALENNYFQTS